MKKLFLSLCLLLLFCAFYVPARAQYFITKDNISNELLLETPTEGAKIIGALARRDTMYIISLKVRELSKKTKNYGEFYIECYAGGKIGYVHRTYLGREMVGMTLARFLRFQKTPKYNRNKRIKEAWEHDNMKRARFTEEDLENPIVYFQCSSLSTKLNVYNEEIDVIGVIELEARKNDAIAAYNLLSFNEEYKNDYYMAIYKGMDVIVKRSEIEGDTGRSKLHYYLSLVRYNGIDKRREVALLADKEIREPLKLQESLNIEITNRNNAIIQKRTLPVVEAQSQSTERVNDPLPKIAVKPSKQLTGTKGWAKGRDGQWVSRPNRIPNLSAYYLNAADIDREEEGLGHDNFISCNLHTMTYGNNNYLVLIKEYNDGAYADKKAKKGWTSGVSAVYYVFDEEELQNFNTLKDNEVGTVKIPVRAKGTLLYTMIEGKPSVQLIESDIRLRLNYESVYSNLEFVVMPNKTKNTVRFFITESYYDDHSSSCQPEDFKEVNNYSLSTFTNLYYETSYANFSNFIKLP